MGKGDPKPGPPKDGRIHKRKGTSSSKMPMTRKQMNTQHQRMTGTRKK